MTETDVRIVNNNPVKIESISAQVPDVSMYLLLLALGFSSSGVFFVYFLLC